MYRIARDVRIEAPAAAAADATRILELLPAVDFIDIITQLLKLNVVLLSC